MGVKAVGNDNSGDFSRLRPAEPNDGRRLGAECHKISSVRLVAGPLEPSTEKAFRFAGRASARRRIPPKLAERLSQRRPRGGIGEAPHIRLGVEPDPVSWPYLLDVVTHAESHLPADHLLRRNTESDRCDFPAVEVLTHELVRPRRPCRLQPIDTGRKPLGQFPACTRLEVRISVFRPRRIDDETTAWNTDRRHLHYLSDFDERQRITGQRSQPRPFLEHRMQIPALLRSCHQPSVCCAIHSRRVCSTADTHVCGPASLA